MAAAVVGEDGIAAAAGDWLIVMCGMIVFSEIIRR